MPTTTLSLTVVEALVALTMLFIITARPEMVSQLLSRLVMGLGLPFRLCAWALEQAETACKNVLDATLRWEGGEGNLTQHWRGLLVLSRLTYGTLAAVIALSTVALDLRRVGPVLFGLDAGAVNLPFLPSVTLATGLLTVAVPALFGSLLLEALEAIPPIMRMYPNPKPTAKRFLRWIAWIGSALTLVMVGLLFLAGQLVALGYTWPQAALLISVIQGVTANVATLVSSLALIYGLAAVVSVVMALGRIVFATLRLPFAACERLIQLVADEVVPWIAYVLSLPGRLLWNLFARLFHLPLLRGPGIMDRRITIGSGEPGTEALLVDEERGWDMSQDLDTKKKPSTQEELIMADPASRQKTILIGVGVAGDHLLRLQVSALAAAHGTRSLLATGSAVIDRLQEAPRTRTPLLPGLPDLSIVQASVQQAIAQTRDQEGVKTFLVRELCEGIVKLAPPSAHVDAQVIVMVDARDAHILLEPLADLKRRLPGFTLVVLAALPAPERNSGRLRRGLEALARLYADGVIATTLLLASRSPLAVATSVEQQERLVTAGLAGLLIGHAQSRRNPTFAEAFARAESAFSGVALTSRSVVESEGDRATGMRGVFGRRQPRQGNAADVRSRAETQAEALLSERATQAVPTALASGEIEPYCVVTHLPLHLGDVRYQPTCEQLEPPYTVLFPYAAPCFVAANGALDPYQPAARQRVQVSVFYPLDQTTTLNQLAPTGRVAALADTTAALEADVDASSSATIASPTPRVKRARSASAGRPLPRQGVSDGRSPRGRRATRAQSLRFFADAQPSDKDEDDEGVATPPQL